MHRSQSVSMSSRGPATVSRNAAKNTDNRSIFNWTPWRGHRVTRTT
ncbi:MAG TPA: proline/betaine transporter [Rickettsia endosymbiont of Ceroptres masudai]|nr:proline/betaine transporter [Rickettsia endosymbiont of Ceroptres masudai]